VGKLQHVAALEKVLDREIDLGRVLAVVQAVGGEGPIRAMMGLACKPMNREQIKSTAGRSLGDVAEAIRAMRQVGFVEDVGRQGGAEVFALTTKGRRFLVLLIDESGPGDGDSSLRDLVEPVRMRRAEPWKPPTEKTAEGLRQGI